MHEIWPNFFLVGAAKAGTTSIYAYLSQHPRVFFPTIKEPHFFTQVRPAPELRFLIEAISKRSAYLRLYACAAGHEVIGDASPSYLWHPEVPQRIRAKVPQAKIAIILRDPVERAYSHYLMDFREGAQSKPFYEALLEDMERPEKGWGISYLYYELGLYAAQLQRYLDAFRPEQVKVLMFDDFRREPRMVLRELTDFLGVDPNPVSAIDTSRKYNSYAAPRNQFLRRIAGAKFSRILGQILVPRWLGASIFERFFLKPAPKPPLDPRVRDLLCSLYDPELNTLERLLGRKLPELRHSWKS
ncbi:MAG: sulfotransferase [Deltaproteobacteria bacterium]|nr:sulfotransferase [Deltaproteobacteria bacterium]